MSQKHDTMESSESLTGEFEYELVEISWSLEYDFSQMPHAVHVADEGECSMPKPQDARPLEVDEEGIAKGDEHEAVEQRREVIRRFWYQLKEKYGDSDNRKIMNESLNEYIYLRPISFEEAKTHSAMHYNSTKAFLRIEEILQKARPVARVPKKEDDNNQQDFECLMIMAYEIEELGKIKLTVGLRHRSKIDQKHQKVEYVVSVLNEGMKLVDWKAIKKRKAPHRKR